MVSQLADAHSPLLQDGVRRLGGPNEGDWVVELPDGGQVHLDLTTDNPNTVAAHRRRPYGEGLEIVSYRRPDGVIPFPPRADTQP